MTMPAPPPPVSGTDLDQSHTALPRMYPTRRPTTAASRVPLGTDYTTWLEQGGYPDVAESAAAFAAGQRAEARETETRTAATTGPVDASHLSPAPPGTVPRLPNLPRPVED